MGLSLVHSRALDGLRACPVQVETHLANGLPSFTLVGLAETEVKEARERVRSALQNAGLDFPSNKKITVNLAPADLPKDSGRFDLPIALGLLAASGAIDPQRLRGWEFAGELSLGGELRAVRGALAMGLASRGSADTAPTRLVLPPGSAEEAALVPTAEVYRARHLLDVVRQFVHRPNDATAGPDAGADTPPEPDDGWVRLHTPARDTRAPHAGPDLADVKGQLQARRALEIAAAGGHSLLLVGPPGSGKSMLAQRLVGLLPPMSEDEAMEAAAIASLRGAFHPADWGRRPLAAPHHTASAVALVGGGSPPRPGEISQAHGGVLFLDELPEFPRAALEALREPLETGRVRIARAARQVEFPARFQLVAAMNPCPCGHLGHPSLPCRCTPDQVARYQSRISGPMLDRIDLQIEVPALPAHELLHSPQSPETTAEVATRVAAAHARALRRQGQPNHALQGQALEAQVAASQAARQLLQQVATRMGWSGRSTHRCLRVARTIADLAGSATVESAHMAEAVQYRRALRIA